MTENDLKRTIPKTQEISYEAFKNLLPKNKPLIGIDYGSVRIGVAVSDTDRKIATPFKIIAKIIELDDIVRSKEAVGFVIGMPYQPDGTKGDTAAQVHLFADRLMQKYGLPILFVDERLSSVHAEEDMRAIGVRLKKAKKTLDAKVARDLLQKVLDQLNKLN